MSKSFNAVDHTNSAQQLSNCCIVCFQYDQIAFLLGLVQWYTEGMHYVLCFSPNKIKPESHYGSRNHKLVKGP